MKIGVVDIKQEDVKRMINREDMLELTRRMTPARASVGRIAGAYFDEEGYVDGTFNTNFLGSVYSSQRVFAGVFRIV